MSFYSDCQHEWGWLEPKQTTGENLLGQTVSCWGQDGICKKCDTVTWRKIEKENDNGEPTERPS